MINPSKAVTLRIRNATLFSTKSQINSMLYVKYSDDYIEYIMHGLVNNTSKHEAIFVSNGEYNEEISKAFSEAGYDNSDIIRISNKIDKAEKEKVIKKYRRNKR